MSRQSQNLGPASNIYLSTTAFVERTEFKNAVTTSFFRIRKEFFFGLFLFDLAAVQSIAGFLQFFTICAQDSVRDRLRRVRLDGGQSLVGPAYRPRMYNGTRSIFSAVFLRIFYQTNRTGHIPVRRHASFFTRPAPLSLLPATDPTQTIRLIFYSALGKTCFIFRNFS